MIIQPSLHNLIIISSSVRQDWTFSSDSSIQWAALCVFAMCELCVFRVLVCNFGSLQHIHKITGIMFRAFIYCLVNKIIMYRGAAQVRCRYSAAGPQSLCAYGLSLSPLGSSLSSSGSLTAHSTQSQSYIKEHDRTYTFFFFFKSVNPACPHKDGCLLWAHMYTDNLAH